MTRRGWLGALLLLTCGTLARAQDGANLESPQPVDEAPIAAPAQARAPLWTSPQTPDEPSSMSSNLWLYLHEERRHDDPKQAIRRKAEAKAAARAQRIAALQWYGQSNSRPNASSMPFMGNYSPSWFGPVATPPAAAAIYRRPFLSPTTPAPADSQ